MQFVRFLVVGLLNTSAGLLCIYGAMWAFGLDYRLANVIGYLVGSVLSFVLNRSWTFRYDGVWWLSAIRWSAVVGACFLLNFGVVVLLYEKFHVPVGIAQLAGVACYTAASFVGGRFFAFRDAGLSLKEVV